MATAKKVPVKKASAKKTASKAASKKAVPKKKAVKAGSFAVIATGGKQYLVRAGDVITVEKMAGDFKKGDKVTFGDVLLKDTGTATEIGAPLIKGAAITAEFVEGGRGQKIDVIQYKQKSRYYKKKGHRQPFMKFKISDF